jgi:hypothetical protein
MTWFKYEEEMKAHEDDAVWSRKRKREGRAA